MIDTNKACTSQDYSYYSEPKPKEVKASLDEVDPELLRTFERLGVPLNEQKRLANVAVDAVFDSVSIHTTFKKELLDHGIIFCSISDAVRDYPDLIKKHLGSVVSVYAECLIAQETKTNSRTLHSLPPRQFHGQQFAV